MTLDSFAEWCYRQRLEGVDINLRSFPSLEKDVLKRFKILCLRKGLGIACIGVSNNFGLPDPDWTQHVQMAKRGVDVAAFLGAPLVRVFAGWTPEGETDEAAWERTVKGLWEVAAYGDEQGVVVGLQNHNHKGLTKTGEDIVQMIHQVNHPNLSHILDTGQYCGSLGASGATPESIQRYDLYKNIEQTAPLSVFVRAKIYRMETGEEEWLDYPHIFGILNRVGYNGWVSIVYEGQEDEWTALPKAVKYLRKFMN